MADKPDYTQMDNETLTAALTENKAKRAEIFALDSPTVAQVDEVETLAASAAEMNKVLSARKTEADEAAKRFAAAKTAFASEDEEPKKKDDEDESFAGDENVEAGLDDGEDGDEGGESGDDEGDESGDDEGDDAEGEDGGEVVTASVDHGKAQKIGAVKAATTARRVGAKTKRRAVPASTEVVITASTGVDGFEPGQRLTGMADITKGLFARTKGFPKHNEAAARQVRATNGGVSQITKASLVSIGAQAPTAMTASIESRDYGAVKAAIADREANALKSPEALTAAGWCAPSTPVYSYISDYVVDGLITVPEVSAPRGGLLLTTGPAKNTQGTALDEFGFTQTEAEAEAGEEKQIESIECPDFVDHRLDAIGYGVTIPLLTQKAYPELVTDALKLAGVMYAHKVNRRVINDIVALSVQRPFAGYGPSFTDTLEAVALLAVKERRRWNLGENAIMEVKIPQWVKEVFRADISRRSAMTVDSVKDAQIAAHFTDRRLAVEYVADWQELGNANEIRLPGVFDILVYPSGTVIKAIEDVVNLSAIYDAASLTVNEYLGVFFEQGILVAKAGYGVSRLSVGVNTAGEMGALTIVGKGDSSADGSF